MKNLIRWIAVPVVALLLYWVTWLLNTFCLRLEFGRGPVTCLIVEITASVIGVIAGIYAACKIAPKGKKAVAIVIASLFIIIALSSLIISIIYKNYTANSIISAIATAAVSIYAICESDNIIK